MLVHILPNVMNTFMVLLTLHVGVVVLAEASLSFLGAGIPPPTPSWGQMVAEGRGKISSAWWLSLCQGLPLLWWCWRSTSLGIGSGTAWISSDNYDGPDSRPGVSCLSAC
jgi:peptide/nickel transport system permease protein